jgi:hypothetical protein
VIIFGIFQKPCRACGLKVSPKSDFCPRCGASAPTHDASALLQGTGEHAIEMQSENLVMPTQSTASKLLEAFANLLRWSIVILVVIGVVWYMNLPETPQQKAAKAQAMTIAQNTIMRLQQTGWRPTWDTLKIDEAKPDRYTFTISYKYPPGNYDAVDADTRSVIRAALAEITKAGFVPTNTVVNGIMVFTQQEVSGETGTTLYRNFGNAFYNPVRDQIDFKRP